MALTFAECESLVEKNFGPGEAKVRYDDKEERALLTNICLHLVNGTKLEDLIANKDDLFFAEHFVLHNIPKDSLPTAIKNFKFLPNDQKVVEILSLIDDKIRKPTQETFHTFYATFYQRALLNKIFSDDTQQKLFCNALLELTIADCRRTQKINFLLSWEKFTAACVAYNIDSGLPPPVKYTVQDYEPLIKSFLTPDPDDSDANHVCTLLAIICYSLVNKKTLEEEKLNQDDLFFAKNFLFHNIPESEFQAAIGIGNMDDNAKGTAILRLIGRKITKPAGVAFCDLHYLCCTPLKINFFPDIQQKKFFCNLLLELLTKIAAQNQDLTSYPDSLKSWDNFYAACKTFKVDLSLILKTDTDTYLALLEAERKTLSSAASQKAIGDKITVLKKLQSILVKPNLDEKNKALVDFIKDKNNIPTLNQRRYVSRGLRHAGEVFIKSLLVFAALIVDIATLAAIKLITGTSLTARAHARFFPVRGEKLADSLVQHCAPLLKA